MNPKLGRSPLTAVRVALLALALLTLGGGSASAMTSLFGGTTLGLDGGSAVRVEAGWPGTRLTYVMPYADNLDVSPQLTVVYGHNLYFDQVGFEPGLEVRVGLWKDAAWSMALLFEPALLMWMPHDGTRGQLGVRVGGPSLQVGWLATHVVNVFTALRLPWRVVFTPEPGIALPVLVDLGTEVEVYRDADLAVNLAGTVSAGPELCAGPCRRDVDLSAELEVGFSVLW